MRNHGESFNAPTGPRARNAQFASTGPFVDVDRQIVAIPKMHRQYSLSSPSQVYLLIRTERDVRFKGLCYSPDDYEPPENFVDQVDVVLLPNNDLVGEGRAFSHCLVCGLEKLDGHEPLKCRGRCRVCGESHFSSVSVLNRFFIISRTENQNSGVSRYT